MLIHLRGAATLKRVLLDGTEEWHDDDMEVCSIYREGMISRE